MCVSGKGRRHSSTLQYIEEHLIYYYVAKDEWGEMAKHIEYVVVERMDACACECGRVCVSVRMHKRVYVRACVRVCVCVRVRVRVADVG